MQSSDDSARNLAGLLWLLLEEGVLLLLAYLRCELDLFCAAIPRRAWPFNRLSRLEVGRVSPDLQMRVLALLRDKLQDSHRPRTTCSTHLSDLIGRLSHTQIRAAR